ncbi:MAG TPA: nicotinate phosphoribosyltransferase [Gemmatimonadaceae bacterium]|nr:nicotinate phosphoribosyltransferase [Gemmatimonadaceae bacterium]
MSPRRKKRLDPAAFALPVEAIRSGHYTDTYFVRTREILAAEGRSPRVTIQVSGKKLGYLSGIDESIAVLKLCSDDWSALTVHALVEGDFYDDWETVMTIEGPYSSFIHLETIYLGLLARRTAICTNARYLVEAARPKPVMFFGARDDHFLTQPGDGYAAASGGILAFSTDAQASLVGRKGVGTIPHALIAAFRGDTVKATKAFAKHTDPAVDLVALVDYDNDSVRTSLEVARALEGRLWGVRLDTGENMVDKSLFTQMGSFRPTGVNAQLVWNVRNALDAEGFGDVKIVVSGGFDAERISGFEEEGVPVDVYGVGASLYDGRYDFTADIVMVDGKPQAKAGRALQENPRLARVQ